MRLIIDTQFKTIEIDGSTNLGELIAELSNMFPDFAWRDYNISSKTIYSGITTTPYVPSTGNPWIQPHQIPSYPNQPSIITMGTAGSLLTGTATGTNYLADRTNHQNIDARTRKLYIDTELKKVE